MEFLHRVRSLIKFNRKTMIILLATLIFILFITLLVLLYFVGNQSKKAVSAANKPVIANVRGHVYHGPEVNAFRQCDGEEEYLVTFDLDIDFWALYSTLASEDYSPVYVEMKVQFLQNEEGGAEYAGQVLVKELYHMAYETQGCELVKDYNFLLHGNEPSWKIIIDENRGVFFQELGQEQVYATYVKPIIIENGWQYSLISGNKPIVIKIREIDNNDNMSGAYYSYSAFVTFNGKTYNGQALIGRPLF